MVIEDNVQTEFIKKPLVAYSKAEIAINRYVLAAIEKAFEAIANAERVHSDARKNPVERTNNSADF